MSRTKTKNSEHSFLRAKERTNFSKSQIKQMMREAQIAGVAYGNLKKGPIKDFIKTKGPRKELRYTRIMCLSLLKLAQRA